MPYNDIYTYTCGPIDKYDLCGPIDKDASLGLTILFCINDVTTCLEIHDLNASLYHCSSTFSRF